MAYLPTGITPSVCMTPRSLGAGALVKPIAIDDALQLHLPVAFMLAFFAALIAVAIPTGRIDRLMGLLALCA